MMYVVKWSMILVLSALLTVALFGCSSTPEEYSSSEDSPFEDFQERANEYIEAGGLAAVGIGESSRVNTALMKAKERGRTELAYTMESKIDALRKDFIEEVGEGRGAEVNALFSSVSKNLTTRKLKGTLPEDLKYETVDGITTAWALMVMNPKVVMEAFEDESDVNKNLYTRFRASQAFKELEEEVKKYNEMEKEKFQEFQTNQ